MDVTAKPALVNKSQTQLSPWKKWILVYLLVIQVLLIGFNIATSCRDTLQNSWWEQSVSIRVRIGKHLSMFK
ncbi:hypothetical protein ISN45_Aa08g013110 [Arabidopsis thaliana x Arabidopsis arenosa]|uniref:Transmembrane protein n=1 Tax=Arabidopsis thaliana x Arabidopsis arenosa TaxID=1240361 RepID=A0A8T1XR68_9BRAS|nr:hypothetical protein ISN45_Aa08g013110 [Arabidopsis thaliana x Arabidopsis arenosa]